MTERRAYDVVRVIARLNVGGPAIHVSNLSAGMDEEFPTLLVAGRVDAGEADMTGYALERGVHYHPLPELGRKLHFWQDVAAFVKLLVLLRVTRPRIVHTHTAKAGTLGRLAAALTGVPIRVHTYHGHVMRGYFSPLAERAVIWIERFLGRLTTRVVTISERQTQELVDEIGVFPAHRVAMIPLGFDFDRFALERVADARGEFRRELGAGSKPIVSVVGRLVPIKNHELLIRATAKVLQAGRDLTLAIVGGGPEEGRLRHLVDELEIGDAVHFVGWRDDLARIYADSTVVALSSDNEGTPVCLIEAMACGCPVIATNVGGVRDVLEGGRLGVMVPPKDVDAFASSLADLLGDDLKRARLAREAPGSVRTRYSVERLVKDMSALYRELLGSDMNERESDSKAQATTCTI